MIAWSTIEAALGSLVADCTPVGDVRWKRQPNKLRERLRIDLDRSPITPIGTDEREREYTAPVVGPPAVAATLYGSQVGQRSFRLVVRCESDLGTPSDTTPADAADVLATLMTRIRRPSSLAALSEAGLALSSLGPVTRVDYRIDGRSVSAAVIELVLLVSDVDLDNAAGSDDWIETVQGGANTLDHADGTPGSYQPTIEAP